MSRHEGRLLVASVAIDFATTPLNSTTFTQLVAALPDNVVRVDVTNTASDGLKIGYGASGVEQVAFQIGPNTDRVPVKTLLNATHRISVRSIFNATLDSGRLFMDFYI